MSTDTDRARTDVCLAMATGGAADVVIACHAAARAWADVEAADRAQGCQDAARTAHRASLFFDYAAGDRDAFTQTADVRAGLRIAAGHVEPQGRTRGRMSDYRGACGSLFGGAY